MFVLLFTMLLWPYAIANVCCPPSRQYEGDVHSIILKTTLKFAMDLDEQKMVMYSTLSNFDYFDYVDLKSNEAYEHFSSEKCFAVQPYHFGCIPTGAVQSNRSLEERGNTLRIFKYEAPHEQGHRNFTTEWIVDDDCVTIKQSLTFPFTDPMEYYYSNVSDNITDFSVFERNLTNCQPLGTPFNAV